MILLISSLLPNTVFVEQADGFSFFPRAAHFLRRKSARQTEKVVGDAIIASPFSSPEVIVRTRVTLFGRRTNGDPIHRRWTSASHSGENSLLGTPGSDFVLR